ncbi:COG4 transport protein-domain-containing protein [Crepidotus variabilis]|uniref:Conserved oligomeric Golgi complex subunit 4 n=1 Tax=Crepidotus variabilis TaxID=179855 RepID=A0A9P6EP17_9AGAR|nr:COG4 transport protein-domain-containing protein [Crepidotus variabilis]
MSTSMILTPSALVARRDPRALTTLPEILSCLSSFQAEESELSKSLSELLKDRDPIASSLHRLHSLVPQLELLLSDAKGLKKRVTNTAKTADRIGQKVKSLDEEMGRVREASDRVAQVMELKASLVALQTAIENQEWEAATTHCARAMALPTEVVSGPFSETVVPTSDNHLPPSQTLLSARDILLSILRQNFEDASRAKDSSATTRFFKLFPSIGWEKEGLEAYSTFVVELVQRRTPPTTKASSPLYYISSLTSLFEGIAMIVDQHQPVVEKYYGQGKMQSVVFRLLEECDRVTKTLKDTWEEDRAVQRKLTETVMKASSSAQTRRSASMDESPVDLRDIDKILSELAGMIGRWHLFKRFLADALKDENDNQKITQDIHFTDSSIVVHTSSHILFKNLTMDYYIPLEMWYLTTTIEKAHKMSTSDMLQTPITSTTPDDVFYILKSIFSRILSTGSLAGLNHILPKIREVFDHDFVGAIRRKMDDVYRNSGSLNAHSRPDRVEKDNRNAFIVQLNDLDISTSHLERLVRDVADSPSISQHFLEDQQPIVRDQILSLGNLTLRLKSSLRSGVEQLFNQLVRPKMRTFISDMYKDTSYVLDEDGYATADYQDLTRKRFIRGWEALIDGYKDNLCDSNFRIFTSLVLDVLLKPWEKYIMGLKYTELGGVRFDRDLRAITAYLTSQSTFGDVRDKFQRLQQISTLLNLDADEDVDEFYNSSGISWRVGPHEARAIASLKI